MAAVRPSAPPPRRSRWTSSRPRAAHAERPKQPRLTPRPWPGQPRQPFEMSSRSSDQARRSLPPTPPVHPRSQIVWCAVAIDYGSSSGVTDRSERAAPRRQRKIAVLGRCPDPSTPRGEEQAGLLRSRGHLATSWARSCAQLVPLTSRTVPSPARRASSTRSWRRSCAGVSRPRSSPASSIEGSCNTRAPTRSSAARRGAPPQS